MSGRLAPAAHTREQWPIQTTSPKAGPGARTCSAALALATCLATCPSSRADDAMPVVRSQRVQLNFQVDAAAGAVTRVDAWGTRDNGRTWIPLPIARQLAAAVILQIPDEGSHGIYLVAHNAAGPSAAPPRSGDPPHVRFLLDRTAPAVQLLGVTRVANFAFRRRLVIRYSAADANLPPRPVTIEYAPKKDAQFLPVAGSLPAAERYEWQLPDSVRGSIVIRVRAEDRGGNAGTAVSDPIELNTPDPAEPTRMVSATQPAPLDDRLPSAPPAGDEAALTAAVQRHMARGEWALAEQRLRELLAANQGRLDARNDLADVLARQGRWQDAAAEYRAVIRTAPDNAPAMGGLATALAAQQDYQSARDVLSALTRARPDDVEALINLGDMQMLAGDRAAAVATWRKASQAAGISNVLAQRVQRRLLIYPERSVP